MTFEFEKHRFLGLVTLKGDASIELTPADKSGFECSRCGTTEGFVMEVSSESPSFCPACLHAIADAAISYQTATLSSSAPETPTEAMKGLKEALHSDEFSRLMAEYRSTEEPFQARRAVMDYILEKAGL